MTVRIPCCSIRSIPNRRQKFPLGCHSLPHSVSKGSERLLPDQVGTIDVI